jgi:hypothetical protein
MHKDTKRKPVLIDSNKPGFPELRENVIEAASQENPNLVVSHMLEQAHHHFTNPGAGLQ